VKHNDIPHNKPTTIKLPIMDEVQFTSTVARTTQPSCLVINLRADVEAVIGPNVYSAVVPPFSVTQIMTMAWVCRRNQKRSTISDREISDRMVMSFGYYRRMALEEVHAHGFQACITKFKDRHVLHNFTYQRLLQSERLECSLQASLPEEASHPICRIYSSTLASSRTSLRRALGNEMASFDRFLDLPPEVRLMIYEEFLRLPAEELQYDDHEFDPRNKRTQLRLSSRSERHELSYHANWTYILSTGRADELDDYKPSRWATERTPEIMALLRVNRQIFEEAMPVFYNINKFHARTLQELTHMPQHCGARRRACFTNISLDYGDDAGPRTAKKAFILKAAKYLHSLQISIGDRHYLEPRADAPLYKSADLVPGMEFLSFIKCTRA
jgi:hypothetical protein